MFKKFYKCLCHVDKEGDDDGVSKPMSEVIHENPKQSSKKPSSPPPLKQKFLATKADNKSDLEDRQTAHTTQDIETFQNGRKSISPIGSIQDLEHHINQVEKKEVVLWEVKEEDNVENELDMIYGTKLLYKRKISKRDIIDVFS